jgi:hypothetical protein
MSRTVEWLLGYSYHFDLRELLFDPIASVIRAVIINDNAARIRLGDHRGKRLLQMFEPPLAGDDETDFGHEFSRLG